MNAFREALYCLKAGVVSLGYPRGRDFIEPILPPVNFRGRLKVDLSRCSACGRCAAACPARLIRILSEGEEMAFRMEWRRCLFCGSCMHACPEGAVSFSREFENTAGSAQELEAEEKFKPVPGSSAGQEEK